MNNSFRSQSVVDHPAVPAQRVCLYLLLVMVVVGFGCSSPRPITGGKEADKPEEPVKPTAPEEPEVPPYHPPAMAEEISPYLTYSIETPYADIPDTPREFRGAWIATVDNIDWPSEPGLPVKQQKMELTAMMDRAKSLRMNAIILQVRPAADAFYHSPFEPWSVYLTGQQGKAPEPFYDPLQFAVKEAHRRGLEIHAWFNPFRAYHPSADGEGGLAPNHIKNLHPEMVVRYGSYYWLDPGQERVQQYSINIITDVVRRYDIDGVHLDDYFYPYPLRKSNGEHLTFPDARSYGQQGQRRRIEDRSEWRRQNVNNFIQRLNTEIKLIDPHVRFGISPFGIWRPGYPRQIKGFDAFNRIYADARKWLQEGWVDYLAPQLYWPIEKQSQSFPVLLEWWHQQNEKQRHLWPGIYTSKLNARADAWTVQEIERQIEITNHHRGATGSIHFSMKALMENRDGRDALSGLYPEEALIPATPWLDDHPPPRPTAEVLELSDRYVIQVEPKRDRGKETAVDMDPRHWVVKQRYGDQWETSIHPGWKERITLPPSNGHRPFTGAAITLVDELGNESEPYLVREVKIVTE
ncbi:glycoside hydrolase family 10 protein [Fodinibius roseus]|nr:family 10 glycosylhydrolase [Fodinibius roseus]